MLNPGKEKKRNNRNTRETAGVEDQENTKTTRKRKRRIFRRKNLSSNKSPLFTARVFIIVVRDRHEKDYHQRETRKCTFLGTAKKEIRGPATKSTQQEKGIQLRGRKEREREKVPQPLIIFKSVKGNDAREGRENVYLFLDSDITG